MRRLWSVNAKAPRWWPSWAHALVFYAVLAVVTIGWHAVSHMQSVCACNAQPDAAGYMWDLKWWPHAIGHAMNPFVSHYLWAPAGDNLPKGATIPTAAIVLTPLTDLFGPVFSFNVAAIASPALAAFTAYLLCRRLVRSEPAALAGGYLFGFGSYELTQVSGDHLNLTLVFLLPVVVHLALRRADKELSRRVYVVAMAAVIVAQLGLSTELLADSVVLGFLLLAAARLLAPQPQRSRIPGLAAETIGAGAIAAVVASPFLYYALISGGFPSGVPYSDMYGLDLLNLVFPTMVTWVGHHDFASLSASFEIGSLSEAGGYLGVASILAFAAWWFGEGRTRVLGRMLACALVLSVLFALGSHLHVAGQQTLTLPFSWVHTLPLLDAVAPSRAVLFVTLAVAIGIAAWLASPSRPSPGRWIVVAVAVVLTFPNLTTGFFGATVDNPSFFATTLYRHYLKRGETVLALPFAKFGSSTLWQAETGFYFYMPEGYVSAYVPPALAAQPTVAAMWQGDPISASALDGVIHQYLVSDIVVDATNPGPWPAMLSALGLRGHEVGGVLLYHVPAAPA
jgi:hypothetical protein